MHFYHDLMKILPADFGLTHSQTPSDTIQTPQDANQTPPDNIVSYYKLVSRDLVVIHLPDNHLTTTIQTSSNYPQSPDTI